MADMSVEKLLLRGAILYVTRVMARGIQVDLITVSLSDVPEEFSGDRPSKIRYRAIICLILRQ